MVNKQQKLNEDDETLESNPILQALQTQNDTLLKLVEKLYVRQSQQVHL